MDVHDKLITTLGESCKVCYTCVRDCPAKTIRIRGGRAEAVNSGCIGCGNCVMVCSQNAKTYYDSKDEVREILKSNAKKIAIVAPSFPAEFINMSHHSFVEMIRDMGFDIVCEVSFGADIVAREYKKLLQERPGRYIATTCPAIVSYVEKYHPNLVEHLARIGSPMIVTARVLREMHGDDVKIVFIGPCVAKKAEAAKNNSKEVDSAITFEELRCLLFHFDVTFNENSTSDFDKPDPGLGSLFALSGGMLQAADMKEDLLTSNIVSTSGKANFIEALKEFENGALNVNLLEVLCCDGCISGAGMSKNIPHFTKRTAISNYANKRISTRNPEEDKELEKILDKIDLSIDFAENDCRIPMPSRQEIQTILQRMGKFTKQDELDCRACGYETCRSHAVAVYKELAESEMCLPYTIERLKRSLSDLNISNNKLEKTKQALFNAEKLASMGQLSAGIAHEINNPLGVILLNASLLLEEFAQESENYEDVQMIVEQAKRCRKIVSGLLNFARKNKVLLQPTNIITLVDQCLKAIMNNGKVKIQVKYKIDNPIIDLDQDQIIQVLTNLIVNSIEAMPDGGNIDILVTDTPSEVKIKVKDNGLGIEKKHMSKIFEPLFTTKQMGKGTGLGLAVTYGIIKMHKGQITVKSNANPEEGPTGTTFKVLLPRKSTEL